MSSPCTLLSLLTLYCALIKSDLHTSIVVYFPFMSANYLGNFIDGIAEKMTLFLLINQSVTLLRQKAAQMQWTPGSDPATSVVEVAICAKFTDRRTNRQTDRRTTDASRLHKLMEWANKKQDTIKYIHILKEEKTHIIKQLYKEKRDKTSWLTWRHRAHNPIPPYTADHLQLTKHLIHLIPHGFAEDTQVRYAGFLSHLRPRPRTECVHLYWRRVSVDES